MTALAIFTEELLCCLEGGRLPGALTEGGSPGRAAGIRAVLVPWQSTTRRKQTLRRFMTEQVLVFSFSSKLKSATSLGRVNFYKQILTYETLYIKDTPRCLSEISVN